MSGKYRVGIVLLLVIAVGLTWWLFFYDPYRPRAYVGITEWEEEWYFHTNHQSHIIEVDMKSGKITDKFEITDVVPYVDVIEIDQERGLLYVAGRIPRNLPPDEREQYDQNPGVGVYDLRTKEHLRTIQVEGGKSIHMMKLSGNGERLLIRNPSREGSGINRPANQPEENKNSVVLELESGEPVWYFDNHIWSSHYISNQGDTIYQLTGASMEYFSFVQFSTKKDQTVTSLMAEPEKIKKRGGMHPDPKETFKLEYPLFRKINSTEHLRMYDRETFELIDTGPIMLKDFKDYDLKNIGMALPTMMSKDQRYSAIQFVAEKADKKTLYLRTLDLEKLEIMSTSEVFEIEENSTFSSFKVY